MMKMKNELFIGLLMIMSSSAHGRLVQVKKEEVDIPIANYVTDSDRELLCKKNAIQPKFSKVLDQRPEYFFKFDPSSKDSIFYISGMSNYRYDMKSDKTVKMPGVVDFVPSPDGRFIATPGDSHGNSMQFFNLNNKLHENTKPIFTDDKLDGLYQSIGKIDKTSYRVLGDFQSIVVKDYNIKEDKSGLSVKPKTNTRDICENLKADDGNSRRLKLPLLSKDGKFLSALDAADNKTKIFKILNDGRCEIVANLGFMAGKADFSYDSKKIIFHVVMDQLSAADSSFASKSGGYGTVPSAYNIGLGVYNIQTKSMERILVPPPNTNYYYPVFKPDGDEILFLSQTQIPSTEDKEYRINVASLKSLDSEQVQPTRLSESKCSSFDPLIPMDFVKSMHSLICNQSFVNPKMANILTLPMDYNECVYMVKSYYEKSKAEFETKMETKISFDQQSLLAACEQLKPVVVNDDDKARLLQPGDVPQACLKCHVGANFTNFSGPEKDRKDKLLERLESKDRPMPPNFYKATEQEREQIKQYLDKLKAMK